jgi:hypothetical protein
MNSPSPTPSQREGALKVLSFGEDLGEAFQAIKAATANPAESLRYE